VSAPYILSTSFGRWILSSDGVQNWFLFAC
jgi:hypothetical protein